MSAQPPERTGPVPPGTGPSDAAPAGVPTCYRHPDRETYLRCSRCDRPICPDCMRDAPVGQQCPECVREANRRTAPTRTIAGGLTVSTGTWVTWTALALNVLVFVGTLVDPNLINQLFVSGVGVSQGEWYRLLTGTFLHQQVFHIAVNLYALFVIGPNLERILGHWRFAVLYLVSALAGSSLSVTVGGLATQSLGASGAVFGLFGATFVVFRRLKLQTGWILSTIVLNLVITFLFSRLIDWRGHVGGLVAGALLALAFSYAPRGYRAPVQIATAVALVVVSLLAVWLRVG